MSTVHLCIDFQERESFWIYAPAWSTIVTNSFNLKRRLSGLGIPTIHVAFIDQNLSEPTIGKMSDVCYKIRRSCGIDMYSDRQLAFSIPVTGEELVALKPCSSATSSSPLMRYLEANHVNEVILSGVFESSGRVKEIDKSCVTITAASLTQRGYIVKIAAETTNIHATNILCPSQGLALINRQQFHSTYGVAVEPVEEIMQPHVQAYRTARKSRDTIVNGIVSKLNANLAVPS